MGKPYSQDLRDRVSYAQASRDLGVHRTLLRDWVKAFGDEASKPLRAPANPDSGSDLRPPEHSKRAELRSEFRS